MTSAIPSSSVLVSNPNRWKALTMLSLAQFLIILDTSIIGVALPTIQQHFGITQTDLQWIFNAYVITFGFIWDSYNINMAVAYSISLSLSAIIGMVIFINRYSN